MGSDKKFVIVIYYSISDTEQLKTFQSVTIVKQLYTFLF